MANPKLISPDLFLIWECLSSAAASLFERSPLFYVNKKTNKQKTGLLTDPGRAVASEPLVV